MYPCLRRKNSINVFCEHLSMEQNHGHSRGKIKSKTAQRVMAYARCNKEIKK